MWVQTGGPPDKPVVIYDYDPTRSGTVPTRLLQGYRGYLMTDGYEGYNALAKTEGIEHLVCWAHVRRRFVEASRVQPKGRKGHADEALELIGRLYGVERKHKEASVPERWVARQQLSLPILAQLRAWLTKMLSAVVPNSALGKALSYLQNYWDRLIRYTERGDLPIDNNRCENAIRPFVVGRKAWLFSDTPEGAHASAVIYSLLQTAKANAQRLNSPVLRGFSRRSLHIPEKISFAGISPIFRNDAFKVNHHCLLRSMQYDIVLMVRTRKPRINK